MEFLVLVVIACILCLQNSIESEESEDTVVLETRLNPDFYEDENAFMEVASALGFGVNTANPYN